MTDDREPIQDTAARGQATLKRFHEEELIEQTYDLRMVKQIWAFVRPHRRYLLGSMVMLVVMAAFGLVRPLVMRYAMQRFESPDGPDVLARIGGLVAALIVVEQGLAFPQTYWMQLAGARSMATLRTQVFQFLHGRKMSFFDRTPIGRLVTRVTNDVDAIGEMFSSGALNAVGDLIRLVAIVVIMLSINWQMSLFAFAAVPPVALFVNWTRRRMRLAYRQVRGRTARMNAYMNEQITGVGVVQAFAREEQNQRDFDDIHYGYRAAQMRAIGLDATLDATIEMVGSICIAGVLWYAGGRTVHEAIDFPTLFAFVAYIDMFFMPVRNLSARYTQVQSALAGAERVFTLMGDDKDSDGAAAPLLSGWPEATEGIACALRGVTFAYKKKVVVLHDVSLEVKRGETVALVGATGSGKSTVTALLLRLYAVQKGKVEVFGRDVQTIDPQQLRSCFSVVPQEVFLFPGTVVSNVASGESEPDRERATAVLESLGAGEMLAKRDRGIDTEVAERGANFSAGERQLIALARALYRDPEILILDEPTASIDSATEAKLQGAMDAAVAGRTALVVAHRLSTIRAADRIVCMHAGRIVEQGTHDDLLALDGMYAQLYRIQMTKEALRDRIEARASAEGT